jgi:DNA-directed RNA polymerase specialized sigma24 family protein
VLDELAARDPLLAEVVDLKFFCGFSFAEIAAMRSVSERTVQRQWEKARIYLHRTLRDVSLK